MYVLSFRSSPIFRVARIEILGSRNFFLFFFFFHLRWNAYGYSFVWSRRGQIERKTTFPLPKKMVGRNSPPLVQGTMSHEREIYGILHAPRENDFHARIVSSILLSRVSLNEIREFGCGTFHLNRSSRARQPSIIKLNSVINHRTPVTVTPTFSRPFFIHRPIRRRKKKIGIRSIG